MIGLQPSEGVIVGFLMNILTKTVTKDCSAPAVSEKVVVFSI